MLVQILSSWGIYAHQLFLKFQFLCFFFFLRKKKVCEQMTVCERSWWIMIFSQVFLFLEEKILTSQHCSIFLLLFIPSSLLAHLIQNTVLASWINSFPPYRYSFWAGSISAFLAFLGSQTNCCWFLVTAGSTEPGCCCSWLCMVRFCLDVMHNLKCLKTKQNKKLVTPYPNTVMLTTKGQSREK